MTVILVQHHVTGNLKCPATASQRRTVIRLCPCCDVQHDSDDSLTVTGIGRLNRKHLTFCLFYLLGRLWGICPARTLISIDGAALIRSWRVTVLFCASQSRNNTQLESGHLPFICSSFLYLLFCSDVLKFNSLKRSVKRLNRSASVT